MKRLFPLLWLVIILVVPRMVFADEGWVIDNFHSDINVQINGEVKVVETIAVDFGSQVKHGIYRDIPIVYDDNGSKVYTTIQVSDVEQNGSHGTYQLLHDGNNLRIKIGDPNRTISGRNTYQIVYLASGILRGFSDHDELYWNVTGNAWPVAIQHADAQVTLPLSGMQKSACFAGYSGSTGECFSQITSLTRAAFKTTESLQDAQGMTIVAGYKKGMAPLITVERPKTFFEKFLSWPSLTTLFVVILFGFVTVIGVWFKNGRDYWYSGSLFGTKNESGTVKPIGSYETVGVEFVPPEKLRPAELGVLIDERADTTDIVSTIIDLATRGYLTITEVPKQWLFGKVDYRLTKKEKDRIELLSYEKLLLQKLFASKDDVLISSLKETFYTELKEIKTALYDDVVVKGLFQKNPETVRQKYLAIGIIVIFSSFFLIGWTINSGIIALADVLFGFLMSGVLLLLFSFFMPKRTAYGRELYRRARGYKLFINTAEKYRQRFFEQKNLFNEVLPYAIMFGLTEKFAKAMGEIGLKNPQTGWYYGVHPFNYYTFGSSMHDFNNSMGTAIASAPKSSGFSGGSSGGGFGGGGGGSW